MPRITEADLKKQIKNKSFSPVYLIYGSEQMFVKSYTKKLCEAVAGKNPSDFNYHTFSGDIDFQELAASLQIMPFMAERNCVVVTDIYFDNMVKDRLDTLKELTSRAWDGTVLIISMPTYVPSKNKTSFTALIKRVEKIGSVCCFEKINSQIIEKYVAKWANENGKFTCSSDILECAKDADILYTDVWASMGQEEEKAEREKIFKNFQINDEVMAVANNDAMVLHCLPAHREEEITAKVFEEHADEIFDEAENRLHAQKAVLVKLLQD